MSLNKIAEIFSNHDIETTTDGKELRITLGTDTITVSMTAEWKTAIDAFFKKKIYDYTPIKRILRKKNYAEFQIIRLDPKYYITQDYTFSSDTSERVLIGAASKEYILAFIESEDLARYIPLIRRRIERRVSRTRMSKRIRFDDLIPLGRQRTAVFKRKGKYLSDEFIERARDRIRACLFHLAFTQGECWELRETVSDRSTRLPVEAEEEEQDDPKIPLGSYNSDAISFYKVAKSSIFPSQTYLSFYHVLEYFFLKVADEEVTQKVKGKINKPGFKPDHSSVSELIGLIKKHDMNSDETELLKMVLRKYVDESELIDKIKSIEGLLDEKIYSKERLIFGERIKISLQEGHTLSNTAKAIKHIRNGLVHSSDRYERDECLVPFSEAEKTISDYIPLITYLAESVIMATSELPQDL